MTQQPKSGGVAHSILWLVQTIMAVSLIWSAMMKLFEPIEKLAIMWPWVAHVPVALVKFTGIVDIFGAVGLVLPSLLRIQPKLTPVAAIGIIALMVSASVFHSIRGEASVIGFNIIFAILAAFVAWGRLKLAPISSM